MMILMLLCDEIGKDNYKKNEIINNTFFYYHYCYYFKCLNKRYLEREIFWFDWLVILL